MAIRVWVLGTLTALLLAARSSEAARVQSPNFIVDAQTQELAQEFAKLAERYRKEKAIEWLGQEMPRWQTPCSLRVTVTMSGAKGATTFEFVPVLTQTMFIEGPLERLRNSVLPHEVTHTVLAHHFRRPVPRWADEGGSVYSEDEIERSRHDRMNRDILNAGRGMPLRRLFNLKDYPPDVMVLYAEGYAISKFLIESSDRQTFLAFVGQGMQTGWDEAAKTYYHYRNLDAMEQARLDHLRKGQGTAVAKNTTPGGGQLVVRQSIPPAQPLLDPLPIGRGVPPTGSQDQGSFRPASQPVTRLGEPIPLAPATTSETPMTTTTASTKAPRYSPPPVVLFPPEPLPLR